MRFHSMIIMIVCAIPALTLGEGPTTRPARPGLGLPKGERRMFPGPWRDRELPPATEEEMRATEQFLKENLPNRYDLFSQLRPNSPMRDGILRIMTNRYRAMLRFKDQDSEMYDQLLREAKLEDDAIGLIRAFRKGDASAESKFREKVGAIVQLSLDGRKARIDRLEEELKKQKDQLAFDADHKEERIDEKTRALQRQFNGMLDGMERRKGLPDKPVGLLDQETGQNGAAGAGQ